MYLCDVTIREAGQLPGREYDYNQKVDAANVLDDLGLDYIQATFPATGEPDQSVTQELAASIDANIVALARAKPDDIDACLNAGADIVEVFGTVSSLHLDHVVHQSRAEMINAFQQCVDRVRDAGAVPHIILTDAFRTEQEHLLKVYQRFPEVDIISLADTVGAQQPNEVRQTLQDLSVEVDPSRIGVHFHDDLGMATANLLIAQEAGVGRGDVSVAALGERAGNAALEEIITSTDLASDNEFGIDVEKTIPACHDVLNILNEEIHPQKAILGQDVLEHEAGIHTQAMLEDPATFEPFDPHRFGGSRRLLFGPQTGRRGVQHLLERAGVATDEEAIEHLTHQLRTHGPVDFADALELAMSVPEGND